MPINQNNALSIMLYIGCPQWSNAQWKKHLFEPHTQAANMLSQYSAVFNSVEGNTTFYADPSPQTVARWRDATPDDFKFTFKFAQRFSHQQALQVSQKELSDWLHLMSPLFEKLGSLMLQLPAQFNQQHLTRLSAFIAMLPRDLPYSIEVRNPVFFDKGEHEKALNRFCVAHQIDRIVMDTRALFNVKPYNNAIIDAQQKKPYLPVHAIALGQRPIVRFVIASMHDEYKRFYQPWLAKIANWLDEGKSPYVFLHTADNDAAPVLAREFARDLQAHCQYTHPCCGPFAGERYQQSSLL